MFVFAFDRDWTVDVNPHPRRDAVPLEWVRHLAHETPHAVYAIGNQQLAEEAAIPGVVDVVGRHSDDWERWLGEKRPDGRYERFPERRERLSLIEDLHPDAEGYVVVDDLDLSDVDGWVHYHAWEFVPAVERGDVHPDLPWVCEPVADGGLLSFDGLTNPDVTSLASFLEESADAPGFEIRYRANMATHTEVLYDLAVLEVSLERPSARPAVRCTPVAPATERFTVPVDDIELVTVVDPPPDLYTRDAETPRDEARGQRRLAEARPRAVSVPALLDLLERDDGDLTREREALRALRLVAAARPEDCLPAIPVLSSLCAREELPARDTALAILHEIGDHDAGAIAPLADTVTSALESSIASVRREAAGCLSLVADDAPEDAVAAVPALAAVVEDGGDGQRYAVYALSRIADTHPEAVRPAAATLGEVGLDDSRPDAVRLNATAGLGHVVGAHPDAGVDLVDDLASLLDADAPKLRNNAVALLGDVAVVHSDVVEPHVETLGPFLTDDDTYARVNASAALARVAEDFPASVAELTPAFVELLADGERTVRENACWALGYLRAAEAVTALEERARDDEDGDVRTRASWALARIDE